MKEFGSDFHYIDFSNGNNSLFDLFPNANYYANGRQALQAIISHCGWKRIWIPDYFCYDIIEYLKKTSIEVCFYHDTPFTDDREEILKLIYKKGDVLLRMNYFGIRAFRDSGKIPVPVIEDHSHDLIGDWPRNSNADWCIASLRKTLPIPEGGILWSPKGHKLPDKPNQTEENSCLVKKRWEAMILKKDYLLHRLQDKNKFRRLFIETETSFDKLPISSLTNDCKEYLEKFNIALWYKQKENNWLTLSDIQSDRITILKKEIDCCNYFSMIILFKNNLERNKIRSHLIENNIYPAILWQIPEYKVAYKDFSNRMLSIPCDGRYTLDNMLVLRTAIKEAFEYV